MKNLSDPVRCGQSFQLTSHDPEDQGKLGRVYCQSLSDDGLASVYRIDSNFQPGCGELDFAHGVSVESVLAICEDRLIREHNKTPDAAVKKALENVQKALKALV